MKEKTIRKLIKLVEESKIDQLEISSWGRKVRITKRLIGSDNGHSEQPAVLQDVATSSSPSPAVAPQPQAATSSVESAPSDADKNYIEVKSPMVGTFYAAPAPDAAPYVTQNQKIEVGQVVCIVEAMKLMNEIESEVAGRVAKILVENAQPVEFGQVLFLIDTEG
jgi:acetyl-CoA carboxylase biotin carboxyl carrier protein